MNANGDRNWSPSRTNTGESSATRRGAKERACYVWHESLTRNGGRCHSPQCLPSRRWGQESSLYRNAVLHRSLGSGRLSDRHPRSLNPPPGTRGGARGGIPAAEHIAQCTGPPSPRRRSSRVTRRQLTLFFAPDLWPLTPLLQPPPRSARDARRKSSRVRGGFAWRRFR
jgi:hypothetical protein